MGLDIRVYKNLKFLTDNEDIFEEDKDFDYDLYVHVIDPSWEDRIKNFKKGYYSGEYIFHGPSLPYSSHGRFRKLLCEMLNVVIEEVWEDKHPNIPFHDLINFADNEGCLDYEIAEKLYKDFVDNRDKFAELEGTDYYLGIYDEWIEACKLAADNKGIILFT